MRSYFPGVRHPFGSQERQSWSAEDPAVWHLSGGTKRPDGSGRIQAPAFASVHDNPKCLLFEALSGVDYSITSESNIHVRAYDHQLCHGIPDGQDGLLAEGTIRSAHAYGDVLPLSVKATTMVILSLSENNETGHSAYAVVLSLATAPEPFDWQTRWYYDWPHRMAVPDRLISGKTQYLRSLSGISRRIALDSPPALPAYRTGRLVSSVPFGKAMAPEEFQSFMDAWGFIGERRIAPNQINVACSPGTLTRMRASIYTGSDDDVRLSADIRQGHAVFLMLFDGEQAMKEDTSDYESDYSGSTTVYAEGGWHSIEAYCLVSGTTGVEFSITAALSTTGNSPVPYAPNSRSDEEYLPYVRIDPSSSPSSAAATSWSAAVRIDGNAQEGTLISFGDGSDPLLSAELQDGVIALSVAGSQSEPAAIEAGSGVRWLAVSVTPTLVCWRLGLQSGMLFHGINSINVASNVTSSQTGHVMAFFSDEPLPTAGLRRLVDLSSST